jgi:hypothetical protein
MSAQENTKVSEQTLHDLKTFFERDVCQRATKPLRDGVEIAVYLDEAGPVSLRKSNGRADILGETPRKPDMSFWVTQKAVKTLSSNHTEDIGEVGVTILQLMASPEDDKKLRAKVHIGLFDLLRNGYLSVLPLGGATVMKFLGSKGFTSMGKIKDAISRMRN